MSKAAVEQTQEMLNARAELERRKESEKGRYYEPNGELEKVLEQLAKLPLGNNRIYNVIIRAGNSAGKTSLAVNIANYLCDSISNPYFDKVPYLRGMPKPCSGRICTTAAAAKKTYDIECSKWFSRGQYTASKDNKNFYSEYTFRRTGNNFDIFTFDQDPLAGESVTKHWAIVDEPMSRRHFTALKSRFRFGGIIFWILTPLEGSGWYHDELETPERIGDDVFAFEISAESNCIEHGIRGVIPHQALADQWKEYDEAELPARRDGKYLHLAGIIYTNYRQGYIDAAGRIVGHEPDHFEPYYQDCWDKKLFTLYFITDPHDRRPWACGWKAVFPNGDIFTVAEWPDECWRPFHKIRSCDWAPMEYAKMIRATEEAIGKLAQVRLMDPNFGKAPKATTKSTIAQDLRKAGQDMVDAHGRPDPFPLIVRFPPNDIKRGHNLVKGLYGKPYAGIRPKLFHMAHCKNHRFGASHYGWKEKRGSAAESDGISETPELQHKDFPDLDRMGALYGFRYIPPVAAAQDYHRPFRPGSGYVGVG